MLDRLVRRQDRGAGPGRICRQLIVDQHRVCRWHLAIAGQDDRGQAFTGHRTGRRPVRRGRGWRLEIRRGQAEGCRRRRALAKCIGMLGIGLGLGRKRHLAGRRVGGAARDEHRLIDQALFRHVEQNDVACLQSDPFRTGREVDRAGLSAVDDVICRELARLLRHLPREHLHQGIVDFLGALPLVGGHIITDRDRGTGDDRPVAILINIARDDAVEPVAPALGRGDRQAVEQVPALDRGDRRAGRRDKAADHGAGLGRNRAASLQDPFERVPLAVRRPFDAADLPAIGLADIGTFDEFGDADIGDRRADAAGPLAVLPPPQRPGQRMQARIVGPDIGRLHQRAAGTRAAGIGAVQPRVIDLDPVADPRRLRRACAVHLALFVEAQAPHGMRDAGEFMCGGPARRGAADQGQG